jgi:hypothetical protein
MCAVVVTSSGTRRAEPLPCNGPLPRGHSLDMTLFRRGILTAGSLWLIVSLSACTGSRSPSPSPSPSISSDVVLVATYGVGALRRDEWRPRNLARRVGALDCLAWTDPRLRGGTAYEVHLRVPRSGFLNAKWSVIALLGGPTLVGAQGRGEDNPVTVTVLSAFNKPPTNMGPQPRRQTC